MSTENINNSASAFQMDHISVTEFQYSKPNTVIVTNGPMNVYSNGATSAEYSAQENKWRGTVVISIKTHNNPKPENIQSFFVSITMVAFFSFAAENTEENKKLFTQLLRTNGAFSVFASMRGTVSAATSALGLSPGFVVPYWDLNHYNWSDLPVSQP